MRSSSSGCSEVTYVKDIIRTLLVELPEGQQVIDLDGNLRGRLGLLPLCRLFLQTGASDWCRTETAGETDLLRREHLRVRRLGVVEERLLRDARDLEVAQRVDAVHDPLLRVLVDRVCHELGLPDADDRGHDQHCLRPDRLALGRVTQH
jgi:hypothetical protein